MGIPQRHADAPYLGGEQLPAANLETDIFNLIAEFGISTDTEGKLDNSNFAPNADIDGSKFLNLTINTPQLKLNSVSGQKILDAQITTAKITDATIPTEKFKDEEFYQTARGDSTILPYTTDTTFTDIVTATITTGPASSNVLLLCWLEILQTSADPSDDLLLRLRRDAITLRQLDGIDIGDNNAAFAFVFPWIDTAHNVNFATSYTLQARETGVGSGAFIIQGAFFNLLEMKR